MRKDGCDLLIDITEQCKSGVILRFGSEYFKSRTSDTNMTGKIALSPTLVQVDEIFLR